MAPKKQNFKKDNPALNFISRPIEDPIETASETNKEASAALKPETKPAPQQTKAMTPEGYKRNPLYIETKSKRVQLILQPSIVEEIKDIAKENGISMNEAFNEAIKDYIAKNTVKKENI